MTGTESPRLLVEEYDLTRNRLEGILAEDLQIRRLDPAPATQVRVSNFAGELQFGR